MSSRLFLLLVVQSSLHAGIVLCQSGPDSHGIERLINAMLASQHNEWYASIESCRTLPDTIQLNSYPYGSRSGDPCLLWSWSFRGKSHVDVFTKDGCNEPPTNTIHPAGVNMHWRLIKRSGKTYITLNSGKLPIMSLEIVKAVIGEPLAGGRPHSISLIRCQP